MTKLLQITKKLQTASISYFANIGVQLSSSFEESDRIPLFETYLGDDNVNPITPSVSYEIPLIKH